MSAMSRYRSYLRCVSLASVVAAAACGTDATPAPADDSGTPAPVRIETSRAVEQQISRFISASGTLEAQEQADVAAEIAGRIVATPVERGTLVGAGAVLVRISAAEAEAQAQEAEANVAQIQARLGPADSDAFDPDGVAEVASARATRDLARAELDRARMLHERKLLSPSEFEQRQAQAENAQRQYEAARNSAEQQRQALAAARARLTLARKAVADTVVRSPFAGVVAERLVSAGDYVTRGTTVASVMRVNPLRVSLTVPALYMAAVDVGRAVSLGIEAYPGETFHGRVRYISPAVQADSRALVVEAVVPNDHGALKPGLFVTARIEQAASDPAVLVPSSALQTASGTSRLFVLVGDHVEERLVTTGQTVGPLIEVTSGLAAGDEVATTSLTELTDGTRVVVAP